MVIRLFFYAPGTRRRVRRLCLAARRAAWYNTCSFWKGGHGCLPFITLQGVCHVDKKTGRRRACRPAGALRAAGHPCNGLCPAHRNRRCRDPHVPRLHRRRSGHRLPVHAGIRVCASAQRPAGCGLYVRRLCRSDRICQRRRQAAGKAPAHQHRRRLSEQSGSGGAAARKIRLLRQHRRDRRLHRSHDLQGHRHSDHAALLARGCAPVGRARRPDGHDSLL